MENYRVIDRGVIRLDTNQLIPDDVSNRDWLQYLQWLLDGNTPLPFEEDLERLRQNVAIATRTEGLRRIALYVPEWGDKETLQMLKSLANLLDWSSASTAQLSARTIAVYLISKLNQIKTATREQLEDYDPLTDPNWP